MTFGRTQSLADDIAAYIADTVFAGSTNIIELLNSGDTVIATASDVSCTDTNNVIAFTSPGGASISSTDTCTGFQIKTSGGTIKYKFQNTTLTVTPGNQDDSGDTFTSTAHGLSNDQPLVIGGSIPTTNPVVSTGDTVFAVNVQTNTFQIARTAGGAAVDITTVAGSDTSFTVTDAVGASASGAIMEITGGPGLTSGNQATFNTFSISQNVFTGKAFA